MNENDFNFVDRFEIDPRPNFKARASAIRKRELDGIPDDIAERIDASPRRQLEVRSKAAIESGRFVQLDAILTDYAIALGNAVAWERREGALKPWRAEDQLKRVANLLEQYAWHREQRMILNLLEEGDDFGHIDFRSLEVHGRDAATKTSIVRRDPRFDNFRPVGRSKEHFYNEWCTPESAIAEAEDAARREKEIASRPFRETSGPGPDAAKLWPQ
jgi:hypothetical protein